MVKVCLFMLLMIGCATSEEHLTMQPQGLCTNTGGQNCCPGSPIVVDLVGDGFNFTNAEDGVVWSLNPGVAGLWAWTTAGSDDAFLVYDRNDNGIIDDGSEMFGNNTAQLASDEPNGFKALAFLDRLDQGGNGDGVIDAHDAVWSKLRLWVDTNHDALNQASEMFTLDAKGIHSLNTVATPSTDKDIYGNEFRFKSTIVADAPVNTTISDVWLQQTTGDVPVDTTYSCTGWGYEVRYRIPLDDVDWLCTNIYTASDEIATNGRGNPSTLVVRTATAYPSLQAAEDRVSALLLMAEQAPGDETNHCDPPDTEDAYPAPDPFNAPSYTDRNGFRQRCTSHTTSSGGCH